MSEIYLDNAATSWPKPEAVYQAVDGYMRRCGGTPARGRHPKAEEAGRILADCRSTLARLLGAGPDHRVVLTSGATESLNLALKGMLLPRSHVVVTELEHNSVLRPVSALGRSHDVSWTAVAARADGTVDPSAVEAAIRPSTLLVACTHASNFLGTRVDVEAIAEVAHRHDVALLVDAAQTAGVLPIDVGASAIDMLAFTGHKSLLGPSGTGGLAFRSGLRLRPLKEGGTGTFSENPEQPETFPEQFEAGSPNMVGIAGLAAGAAIIEKERDQIRKHKIELVGLLREGLRRCPAVRLYGSERPERSVGIVSFNVADLPSERVAELLWKRAEIMVRAGLHCAALAHDRIGTRTQGTVRVGLGFSTTREEVGRLVEAVGDIARSQSGM